MPGKVDKVIVTNFGALHGKYGAADANVHAALTRWVQADLQRGLVTEVVAVDDAAAMQAAGGPAVTNALDCAQNKQAIDDVYRAFAPDYIVILGSIDVIPHQDMLNPLYRGPGGDDPDEHAFGDLPYACDTPYGQDISAYKGPTRVVSRLPDRTGAQDPQRLLDLIDAVIRHQPRPRADFQDYHAVSAEVWKDSTQLSARNMFGSDSDLQLVPPAGRPWPGARLARLVHFYNCHGASVDPQFYGQRGTQYPPALNSQDLAGNVTEGAVVTAECCYGAELYATSAVQPVAPTCNIYLEAGAIGMWAGTTIAYGPASGNGQADLITQFFIMEVLAGASTGRAALEARQRFVRAASPAGPEDLKTLAQFNLYGDASVVPVEIPTATKAPPGTAESVAKRATRVDRRLLLARQGVSLLASEPDLVTNDGMASDLIIGQLRAHIDGERERVGPVLGFRLRFPDQGFLAYSLKEMQDASDGYVVAFVRIPCPDDAPVRPVKLLVGRVQGGQVVRVSTVVSR
ncbi:hypothetical protein [Sphingomonas solaris]|uniref:Gingipain domain-containing protein n=1 Tax=Alterirhizorhabdus solaris TaxID=2529389 RepID=A0A558RC94_9SPHN|nr:hypothetical protein [Sphingomonas solaris]TVV76960.1 hypothetical protein FOY91_02655 [Sphingomonas solaris]